MYNYENYDYYGSFNSLNGILAFLGTYLLFISAILIFMIFCMWKIYKKAGKNGWEAVIPVYNIIVLLQIVELPVWYIVLFLIPIANIYVLFKVYIELAHKFGKSTGFGVAMVFLGIIFLPMLAFGNASYNGVNDYQNNDNYNKYQSQQAPQYQTYQQHVDDQRSYSNSVNEQSQMLNTSQPLSSQVQQMSNFENKDYKFCPNCGNKVGISVDTCFMCGYKF